MIRKCIELNTFKHWVFNLAIAATIMLTMSVNLCAAPKLKSKLTRTQVWMTEEKKMNVINHSLERAIRLTRTLNAIRTSPWDNELKEFAAVLMKGVMFNTLQTSKLLPLTGEGHEKMLHRFRKAVDYLIQEDDAGLERFKQLKLNPKWGYNAAFPSFSLHTEEFMHNPIECMKSIAKDLMFSTNIRFAATVLCLHKDFDEIDVKAVKTECIDIASSPLPAGLPERSFEALENKDLMYYFGTDLLFRKVRYGGIALKSTGKVYDDDTILDEWMERWAKPIPSIVALGKKVYIRPYSWSFENTLKSGKEGPMPTSAAGRELAGSLKNCSASKEIADEELWPSLKGLVKKTLKFFGGCGVSADRIFRVIGERVVMRFKGKCVIMTDEAFVKHIDSLCKSDLVDMYMTCPNLEEFNAAFKK